MKKNIVMLLGILVIASCAAPQKEVVKRRFFWPPPPDEPKIEFIAAYSSNKDLPKKANFMTFLTGDTTETITLRKPLGIASDGEGMVVITDMIPLGGSVWDLNANTVDFLTKETSFQLPSGAAFDSERLYVADNRAGNVKVFARKNLAPLYTIGDGDLEGPNGLAVNEALQRIYIVETKAGRVSVYNTVTKAKMFSFGKTGDKEKEFNRPWGVCVDKNGDVYISDGLNARIQIFDKDGNFITMFGRRGDKAGGFSQVKGIGVDSDFNIYVIDPLKAVQVFNRKGDLLGLVGAPGVRGVGAMNLPMGLYIDNKDRIYVVDQMNRQFHMFQYMNEEYKKANPVKSAQEGAK